MSKVIIDIETIGRDFAAFEEKDQEYLLKYAKTEEDREAIKNSLALHALTGEVVTIGMLNPETRRGVVFLQNKGEGIEKFEKEGMVYEVGTEKEILEKFWDVVKTYQQVITFNGRSFDIPYLMMRSAINQVRVTRNLMGYRYTNREHCDLMEQFTFYGASRKFSLDFYAKAFGIKSSKEEGIDGSMIGQLYQEKRYLEVAYYCARDLQTTRELYEYWYNYLKF
jgi:DNA polymerase elongation subunit (family B)